jgi:PEP-CTERM motif
MCPAVFSMERLNYEVNAMRKVFGVLALLILVLTVSPAHADGVVNYTVTGTYATGDTFSSTPISNPGDSFTFTFSVDPASLAPGPALGPSVFAVTSLDYTDSLNGTTVFSFTDNPAQVLFFLGGDAGGLFDLDFSADGEDFVLQLLGPDPGFINGPIITLNTGTFDITPGTPDGFFSLLGELNPPDFNFDAVGAGGTVTAVQTNVPEPSSFLLLGSGFLALGSFARKRLLAR